MSFDLTNVIHKTDLPISNPPPVNSGPGPTQLYNTRKERLTAQIQNRLANTADLPLNLRIGFLTEEDRNALSTGLTDMGYTCSCNDQNTIMSIQ